MTNNIAYELLLISNQKDLSNSKVIKERIEI
jgi:hypothetical protein